MGVSLVLATLLCLTTWMTSVHTTNGPADCQCVRLSTTKIDPKRIKSYTIQIGGACPVAAVVFLTKQGKRVCSDPNLKWTQNTMRKVDEAIMAQSEEGSTSDSIATPPPVTAERKKNPRRKSRDCQRRRTKQTPRGGRRSGQRKVVQEITGQSRLTTISS